MQAGVPRERHLPFPQAVKKDFPEEKVNNQCEIFH